MTLTVRDFYDMSGETARGLDDPFAAFGEAQAPAGRGHPANRFAKKHDADLSPLEKKLREKQRLSARYKALRRVQRQEILAQEPRLRDFMRYLRSVPSNGDDLPQVLQQSWLPQAPRNVRLMALELVNRRTDQINRSLGFEPLDDPLPVELGGAGDDTRKRCADVLYPMGRF